MFNLSSLNKNKNPAMIFIFFNVTLNIVGIGLIMPILPELVSDVSNKSLKYTSFIYGSLLGIYSLVQFIFSPILGSLSDQFGRRPVILLSLLGSGLDYFLMAWAPTLTWLFIGRFISGITGANISSASSYISDISPLNKRSQNFGLLGAAFGAGFIFGPVIGGVLGEINIRLPFIVSGILSIINFIFGYYYLPESLLKDKREKFNCSDLNPLKGIKILFKTKVLKFLSISYFILYVAFQVYPGIWMLYTKYRYGWSKSEIGLSFALVGIMSIVVQGLLLKIIIRMIGERNSMIYGTLIMGLAMMAYGISSEAWMIYVTIIIGSLSGIGTPALQGILSKEVKHNQQGKLQGALMSIQSISGFIGPLIFTSVFSFFVSGKLPVNMPGIGFFLGAILSFIALIIACKYYPVTKQKS